MTSFVLIWLVAGKKQKSIFHYFYVPDSFCPKDLTVQTLMRMAHFVAFVLHRKEKAFIHFLAIFKNKIPINAFLFGN